MTRRERTTGVGPYWIVRLGQAHSACWYHGDERGKGVRRLAYRFATKEGASSFAKAQRRHMLDAWVIRVTTRRASPTQVNVREAPETIIATDVSKACSPRATGVQDPILVQWRVDGGVFKIKVGLGAWIEVREGESGGVGDPCPSSTLPVPLCPHGRDVPRTGCADCKVAPPCWLRTTKASHYKERCHCKSREWPHERGIEGCLRPLGTEYPPGAPILVQWKVDGGRFWVKYGGATMWTEMVEGSYGSGPGAPPPSSWLHDRTAHRTADQDAESRTTTAPDIDYDHENPERPVDGISAEREVLRLSDVVIIRNCEITNLKRLVGRLADELASTPGSGCSAEARRLLEQADEIDLRRTAYAKTSGPSRPAEEEPIMRATGEKPDPVEPATVMAGDCSNENQAAAAAPSSGDGGPVCPVPGLYTLAEEVEFVLDYPMSDWSSSSELGARLMTEVQALKQRAFDLEQAAHDVVDGWDTDEDVNPGVERLRALLSGCPAKGEP